MAEPATDPPATPSWRPRTAWRPLGASMFLIGLAYYGDQLVATVIQEGLRNFNSAPAVAAQVAARLIAAALLTALGWLVLHDPRRRIVGVLMMVVGLYFTLGTLIWVATSESTSIALPPFPIESGWSDLLPWTSAAVVVFGAFTVLWPTPEQAAPDR